MRPSTTARRYAQAAFDVAQEHGEVDQWANDLRMVTEQLSDPTVSGFFKDPEVTEGQKIQTVEQAFSGVRPEVLNLLKILVTRHRTHLLPAILLEFERLQREASGIEEAYVTVARQIDESEKASIQNGLSQATGKTMEIHTNVDPRILGGLIVRINDQLIDGSVSGRLQRLRQSLAV